jgi:hypothetical protein
MKTSVTKSTSLLKKYIKEKYNMKVSAKSDFYSGGSSLRIKYDLGLSERILKSDLSRLKEGNFDGMIDMYEYKESAEVGIKINDTNLITYSYVFVDREMSSEFILKIAKAFFTRFSFKNIELPEAVSDIHKTIDHDILGHWTISQYLYQHTKNMNFLTNEESQITEVFFKEDANINSYEGIEMFYILNGVEYSTKQTEIKKELETIVREKTIISNGVKMIDYSEKAIAVIGDTYEIKEELKKLGGRFNKFLTVDGLRKAGWIFSKNQTDEVSNLLLKYSEKN